MQWTVQVGVVLLNVVWIVFFLQPDPFSVSVQRRSSDSSDEEILFGEFCIQPPPVKISSNETNSNNSAYEASRESNLTLHESHSINKTKSQHSCQCNRTAVQQKDLYSSQLSHIDLRPPAPGCEPKIFMTFPNMEVCMDMEIYFSVIAPLVPDRNETTTASPVPVLGQTTPASPPVLQRTSAEVTTVSGGISTSSSEAAPVRAAHHSITPVPKKVNQGPRQELHGNCCRRLSSTKIPLGRIKGYKVQNIGVCPLNAIIHICVDPNAQWIQKTLKTLKKLH